MTCMSCKIFFRRYANRSNAQQQCLLNNDCEINKETRKTCSSCRLKKCLTLGMDPNIIGTRHHYLNKSNKSNQLPKPCTLNLLENDRSTLTKDEWNLLSNIIHAYDATNIISQTKDLLRNQSTLPVKLRSKASTMFDIVRHFYSIFQLIVECTPYYQTMTHQVYEQLIQQNSEIFGSINSMFIVRETKAMDYPAFLTGCDVMYPKEVTENFIKFIRQMHPNVIYIKIILMILAFSNTCSIVRFDPSAKISSTSNSILIFKTQSTFVTIFWRYLLYQQGFQSAVQYFSDLSKYIVNLMQNVFEQQSKQHNEMIHTLIEDTTRQLTIEC